MERWNEESQKCSPQCRIQKSVNLEWVVGREVDVEEVDATGVRALCWSHDSGLPLEQIVTYGSCTAVRGGILLEVHQFLLQRARTREHVNLTSCVISL
jgi:hypothetical protein